MSNRSKQLIAALFLFIGFFSCSSDGETTEKKTAQTSLAEEVFTKVQIELVDSLMVDILAKFSVYDYNPKTGLFLAGDIGYGIVAIGGSAGSLNRLGHLIIDRTGEILHQTNHTDRGPDGHGGSAVDHFFMSDSTYGVLSKLGLLEYKLNGDLVKKHNELNTLDFIGYPNYDIGAVNSERMMILGLAKGVNEAGRAWDSLYQIVKPLRFFDLNKFVTGYEPIDSGLVEEHGFPDHAFYSPGSKYFVNQFPPRVAFNSTRNEAYALYPELPRLEVYNMQDGMLKGFMDLQPDYFDEQIEMGRAEGGIKGYENLLWLNKGGRMASSYYKDLTQLGPYTLLRYNKAIPKEQISQLVSGPGFRKDENWPGIRRKHYKYYYQLFKDGKKVVPDFEFPDLEPKEGQGEFRSYDLTHGTIVGGDGLNRIYVLVPNEGDTERDYELIRVYKFSLTN